MNTANGGWPTLQSHHDNPYIFDSFFQTRTHELLPFWRRQMLLSAST